MKKRSIDLRRTLRAWLVAAATATLLAWGSVNRTTNTSSALPREASPPFAGLPKKSSERARPDRLVVDTIATDNQAAFHWALLESTNYHTYVINLRAVGCPEATIRDIIQADVRALCHTAGSTQTTNPDSIVNTLLGPAPGWGRPAISRQPDAFTPHAQPDNIGRHTETMEISTAPIAGSGTERFPEADDPGSYPGPRNKTAWLRDPSDALDLLGAAADDDYQESDEFVDASGLGEDVEPSDLAMASDDTEDQTNDLSRGDLQAPTEALREIARRHQIKERVVLVAWLLISIAEKEASSSATELRRTAQDLVGSAVVEEITQLP